jgi:hypothetical protein
MREYGAVPAMIMPLKESVNAYREYTVVHEFKQANGL